MSEMVERAARAIREAFPHQVVGRHQKPAWDDMLDCDRETWRKLARAAIASLRVPTPTARDAMRLVKPMSNPEAEAVCAALIDAALAAGRPTQEPRDV